MIIHLSTIKIDSLMMFHGPGEKKTLRLGSITLYHQQGICSSKSGQSFGGRCGQYTCAMEDDLGHLGFLMLYCCNHNHFWFPQGLNSWQKDHLPDLPLDHFRIRMMPPSQMFAARGAGFNRWILPRNEIYICKHPSMLLYVCFFSVPTYITTSSMDFCSISSDMRGSKGTTTMLVISYLCLFMSI